MESQYFFSTLKPKEHHLGSLLWVQYLLITRLILHNRWFIFCYLNSLIHMLSITPIWTACFSFDTLRDRTQCFLAACLQNWITPIFSWRIGASVVANTRNIHFEVDFIKFKYMSLALDELWLTSTYAKSTSTSRSVSVSLPSIRVFHNSSNTEMKSYSDAHY